MSNELTRQYCTFYVDEMCFGIEVHKIQEILKYQPVTRIPLADKEIAGLINLRGQIVIVIDLRRRLQMSDRSANQQAINVIVQTESGGVSLLVDKIGDVLDIDESLQEPPPQTLKPAEKEFVSAVYKLEKLLLLVLDVNKVIATHQVLVNTV